MIQAQTFGSVPSKKEDGAMDTGMTMNMYCKFCSDVSISNNEPSASVLKMIVLFQKNMHVSVAYDALFGSDSFLDWEHTPILKTDKLYCDSGTWVVMMRYLDINMDESQFKLLIRDHAVFAHFDQCFHNAGLTVGISAFVAVYLLVNISRLQALTAFEQYFSRMENRNVRKEALIFFSQLANVEFDKDERTKSLIYLIKNYIRIREEDVNQELEIMATRSQELGGLFKQKMLRAVIGRPRLRSKLRQNIGVSQGSMFQLDLLSNWCNSIRFPNVFSLTQKKRLYFIMSQVHLDHPEYIRKLLPDNELSDLVLKHPVKQPEVDVIYDAITMCKIAKEPFAELHKFRAECFHSFALEQKAKLRLNDLLHLYIAAYQHTSVWKSVWKSIFPVLSIQIIRDVESFVERVPFVHVDVVSIMFNKNAAELKNPSYTYVTQSPTPSSTRPSSPQPAFTPFSTRPPSPTEPSTPTVDDIWKEFITGVDDILVSSPIQDLKSESSET